MTTGVVLPGGLGDESAEAATPRAAQSRDLDVAAAVRGGSRVALLTVENPLASGSDQVADGVTHSYAHFEVRGTVVDQAAKRSVRAMAR